ncbi:hypothetical protein WICPIJ_000122 [Wickerhamomyces pijperi]|uniref:Uncharacterized protein n=1 Tax=Wickerhamomyces pijperi TaxID=599730 RepID=A0A9P8QHI1_WICPI|nr:hypothetical protein WICPIJ_000122 [Wickerhamomyces pijperi]
MILKTIFQYNPLNPESLPIQLIGVPPYMSLPLKVVEYSIATIQFFSLLISFLLFAPIVVLLTLDFIVYVVRISKLLTNLKQLRALFNINGKESHEPGLVDKSAPSSCTEMNKTASANKITVRKKVVYEQYVVSG